MCYAVKEIFYTLQGEGAQTGRAAVFCRFAGCNLWSGREQDRATAICQFCDTDFADTNGPGGGKFAIGGGAGRRGRREVARQLQRTSASLSARAANRCCNSTPPDRSSARPSTSKSPSRPTAPSQRRTASTGSASARRPEAEFSPAHRRRVEAGLSAAGRRAGKIRGTRFPQFLPAADGRPRPRRQHATSPALLHGPPAVAPEPADAQDPGDSVAAGTRDGT